MEYKNVSSDTSIKCLTFSEDCRMISVLETSLTT